jgi:hypothetical protein
MKTEGLLSKIGPRRGIGDPGSSDLRRTARIRGRGKKEGAAAGGEEGRGGAPWTAVKSSPALHERVLQCLIFKKRGTGVKRRRWRPRP